MNRAAPLVLLITGISAGLISGLAQVAVADPAPTVVAVPSPGVSEQVTALLVDLAIRHPWFALVITVMGALRFALKPLMFFLRQRATATPDTADDLAMDRVERSAWFAAAAFALDWFGSIKIPQRTPPTPAAGGGTAIVRLSALALLLPGLLLLPGCTTPAGGSESPVTPARVEKITRLAVWTTATAWIAQRPDTAAKFRAAQRGVNALVTDETWDVVALASALTSSGSETFTGPEGRLIVSGTTLLVDTIAGDRVDLRRAEFARAVVLGAQAGLGLALGDQ